MVSRLPEGFRPKEQSGHVSLIARDELSNGRGEFPELGARISDRGPPVLGGDGNPPKLSSVIDVKMMLFGVDIIPDVSGSIKAVYL